MSDDNELFRTVRKNMWSLLSDRYRTNRRARSTHDEFVGERQFWPEFTFEEVVLGTGAQGEAQIQVLFHDSDEPETRFGFRISLEKAIASWSERVGGRDPRRHPEMFAAELIWFMVCFIGVADLESATGGGQAPHWINTGSEIFGKLKNNPNMETFESHH
ncbi:hypothetical protein [Streptomyces sp. TP-A0874]|uniref:hypothetical protein n=1 Tax=Streptomyces sp. TP-A0874 TaxID=549819 RepID=UPI0008536E71|nr:hypothetical protein [Streptomyces sp. TP-A0874]